MCYYAKFGRSALKCVGINVEPSKFWERWNCAILEWEAWLTHKIHARPHVLPCECRRPTLKGV